MLILVLHALTDNHTFQIDYPVHFCGDWYYCWLEQYQKLTSIRAYCVPETTSVYSGGIILFTPCKMQ